jgi:hypothetical protein
MRAEVNRHRLVLVVVQEPALRIAAPRFGRPVDLGHGRTQPVGERRQLRCALLCLRDAGQQQRTEPGAHVGAQSALPDAQHRPDLPQRQTQAIVAGQPSARGGLPLRERYLPSLDSVLNIAGRLCAGGVPALCAIARPSDKYRGEADYLLLVQERSGHVLNAAHQLAVIPKGFHKPFADYRAGAPVGAALRREMEEELFGRADVDITAREHVSAAPMHRSRLSEPMRWLLDTPDALRMECTGFGLNLVSGNYEFASLIVIDDEEFWDSIRWPHCGELGIRRFATVLQPRS